VKHWQSGQLIIHTDRAEFVSRSDERLLIQGMTRVDQPTRRQLYRQHDISSMVNTWIAVHYATPDGQAVAYFNDGRPLAHYLSHKLMRTCLSDLVVA
jgi:hypothetical protein